MKKLKVMLLLALASTVLLFGCKGDEVQTPSVVVEPILDATPAADNPTEAPVADEDLPPEEGMVKSRITNEWVTEEQNNQRPVAVMIPNSSTASHFGLSNAAVLYEVNVEGEMTRLMAVFDKWQDMTKIGNIRSCRDYYVYWSFEWDAIYIHFGGPWYIYDVIGREDTDNIDCISQPDVGKYNNAYTNLAFRDDAKNSTDNAFTSAENIKEACDSLGISLTYRDGYADPYHYKFASNATPNMLTQYPDAFSANKIDMSEAYPMTNSYFIFNEETGTYDRFQHFPKSSDEPHVDLANNEQLSFKNVIVQNTYHEVRDEKGYLAFQCHDTTRDGYFFTNGKGIHVTWKKESDYGATRYYDDDGNEVEFNTGKTMVLIVEDGDTILVDDKEYTAKK